MTHEKKIFQIDQGILNEAPSSSKEAYQELVTNGWFWGTVLSLSALIGLSGFTLWQNGQLRALQVKPTATVTSTNPFGEPASHEQASKPLPSTASQTEPTFPQPTALTTSDHQSGACPSCFCTNPQPSPYSSYRPLKRFNSFRSAGATTRRDQLAERIMQDSTRLLHDIQLQVRKLNEIETYDNVSSPLSEFEQRTGWVYNRGPYLRQEDVRREAARPPIPPPTRTSSLPRGAAAMPETAIEMQDIPRPFPPLPPPSMLAQLQ